MKFYWELQALIKYAPSYHTAIMVESTAEIWLQEQTGAIPYLNVYGNQRFPSYWEDIPEIEECWEEFLLYYCPIGLRSRKSLDLRRI